MARKDREHDEGATGTSYHELAERMASLHVSRIEEMPRIELYLDQLLSLVSDEVSFAAAPGEKIITGPMVNNYVKQHVLPAPTRKRYTRRHVATLIFVCLGKRVLSMAQIKEVHDLCEAAELDVYRAYDELIGLIEDGVGALFTADPAAPPMALDLSPDLRNTAGAPVGGALNRVASSIVTLISHKVYAERMLEANLWREGQDRDAANSPDQREEAS